MIIDGKHSLAHVEKVAWVKPIEGADNIELVGVLGWVCTAEIGEFDEGDLCVFIEIGSKVPEKEWSEFLSPNDFEIKTMHVGESNEISQGIALPLDAFDVEIPQEERTDVTALLGISHSDFEDGGNGSDEASNDGGREIMESSIGKWLSNKGLMTYFSGDENDIIMHFPDIFEYISKTNQDDCENIPQILEDKTPYIRTQKCDGLSATYILKKAKSSFGRTKYEFYICSDDMRLLKLDDDTDIDDSNPYLEMAYGYDIKAKLKNYLKNNKDCEYICWQGEICGPEIKGNPQKLSENYLFCFQMIDSKNGVFDIREAKKIWDFYDMESVPIETMTYLLPDDFEKFKQTADGCYDASVCEGQKDCAREGWVYYNTSNPGFSFKNISRKYLLKKK